MDAFLTFRSVTFAQRGEGVLRRGGVTAWLQRTPRWMETQGCGYCLALHPAAVSRSVQLLRENRVPFRRAYVPNPAGELEALEL